MDYFCKLTFGDWSLTEVGKTKSFTINMNYSIDDVRNAYNMSCRMYKFKLHDRITDYKIKDDDLIILKELGFINKEIDKYEFNSIEEIIVLIFWFISLSIPDLKYTVVIDEIENLFGYNISKSNYIFTKDIFK